MTLVSTLSPTAATVAPGQAAKSPAQPAQQAAAPVQAGATPLATSGAPPSATPQGQLPPQTQAHMPTQSPTSLQVKTQGGGAAQLQLQQQQQSPQLLSVSGLPQQVQVGSGPAYPATLCRPHVSARCVDIVLLLLLLQVLAQLQAQQGGGSLPQHIKLQLPIQIQQGATTSAPGGQVGLHTPGGSAHSVQIQPIRLLESSALYDVSKGKASWMNDCEAAPQA